MFDWLARHWSGTHLKRRGSALLLLVVFLLPTVLMPLSSTKAHPASQTSSPEELALSLMERMSPEDRIGQLFLVNLEGSNLESNPLITQLIENYHISGVILNRDNDNFQSEQTIPSIIALNRQLQTTRWNASRSDNRDPATDISPPIFIPLFIGISQEGNGFPNDQILQGVTQLPSALALGATWDPDLAKQVGQVAGEELSQLGFNLLLGPSLDVLQNPHWQGAQDLGVRTFGGDPFWVGEIGQAYISGLHQGSNNRLAVIAKHFPGYGTSDRLPELEVATVRKSLQQLQLFDLRPFFNVTGQNAAGEQTTDGLLTAHLRFQQFDNTLSGTTRPVSFDPQAMALLINLPEIHTWRESGGILISDDLGGQAIRRYYTVNSQAFDPRRVTLNAFLAGNDLLVVSDFRSIEFPDPLTAAARTLEFFTQKYREETAFAQRVDQAVLRILTLKYRLYGRFTLDAILPSTELKTTFGQANQVVFEVARQAATLVYPTQAELDDLVPDPPNGNDRIVFITDTRLSQQCSQCAEIPQVGLRDLEQIVNRRYGPQGSGLIRTTNLSSYSFDDLGKLLASKTSGQLALENDLKQANWIAFLVVDDQAPYQSYQNLRSFLTERPELFQQRRIIVFALNAPYYLDATDISKLTAFYALYSQAPSFIDMAAYLLFRELPATGALPISVQGVNYLLADALLPDSSQMILLSIEGRQESTGAGTATPVPANPEVRVGDAITVVTSVILDTNGNPVTDNTPVDFVFTLNVETGLVQQRALTKDGVAKTTYVANGSGVLTVRAQSGQAQATPLLIDITFPGGITATPPPTPQPTYTPVPSFEPTTLASPTNTPVVALPETNKPDDQTDLIAWLLVISLTAFASWSIYRMLAFMGQVRWGIRVAFLAFIGGMLSYSYIAFGLPGASLLMNGSILRGLILAALVGIVLGGLAGWLWRWLSRMSGKEITATPLAAPKRDA